MGVNHRLPQQARRIVSEVDVELPPCLCHSPARKAAAHLALVLDAFDQRTVPAHMLADPAELRAACALGGVEQGRAVA
jgi:hypothetical protein